MSAAARARAEYGLVLALDVVGAAAALLISTRIWQTVTAPRPRPFAAVTVDLSGRTVDAAVTALALAALAAVVAVVATRRVARQAVGVALGVVGVAIVWRSLSGFAAVSSSRAQSLAREHHRGIVLTDAQPHVAVHTVWPALCAVAGGLIVISGVIAALRGQHWHGMSTRYEAPTAAAVDGPPRAPTDLAMWNAIERGDDPTS